MTETIISINNLGKRYRLGQGANGRYIALRDVLTDKAKALFHRNGNRESKIENRELREIWALRNVSFEVKRGEVIGIIGRNGAGKSTLLKILSRITEPTEGRVQLRGRVGSLLEVGTGFHPELTGRENIFLNGAILGMTKAEIKGKFDEIVDFAEIEKFLDTPVKRYSSGMYVRLAFAVAAHLEPEILVVDEVLAVGDSQFQKKCLGKMHDVSTKEGRTVLFVSHNLAAVTQLCERAIWLDSGRIQRDGQSQTVTGQYLSSDRLGHETWTRSEPSEPDGPVLFESVSVAPPKGESVLRYDAPIDIQIDYTLLEEARDLCIALRVVDANGTIVFATGEADLDPAAAESRTPARYRSVCEIPAALLRPGQYDIWIQAQAGTYVHAPWRENVVSFEVAPVGAGLNCARVGVITPVIRWTISRSE